MTLFNFKLQQFHNVTWIFLLDTTRGNSIMDVSDDVCILNSSQLNAVGCSWDTRGWLPLLPLSCKVLKTAAFSLIMAGWWTDSRKEYCVYIYIYYIVYVRTSSLPCCWYLSSGCLVSGCICTKREPILQHQTRPTSQAIVAKKLLCARTLGFLQVPHIKS